MVAELIHFRGPLVDIHEYADRFELYVDLPGVDASTVAYSGPS